jgi:hypothetical protein
VTEPRAINQTLMRKSRIFCKRRAGAENNLDPFSPHFTPFLCVCGANKTTFGSFESRCLRQTKHQIQVLNGLARGPFPEIVELRRQYNLLRILIAEDKQP